MYIEVLESLLHDVPPNILKYVLGQFSKVRFYNPEKADGEHFTIVIHDKKNIVENLLNIM